MFGLQASGHCQQVCSPGLTSLKLGGGMGQQPGPPSSDRATADSNTPSAARLWLYPAENGQSHLGRVISKMTELPKVNRGNNHNRNFLCNVSL